MSKIFADGIKVFSPSKKAEHFMLGKMEIEVDKAVEFFNKHQNDGKISLDILIGRTGFPYVALNEYVPKERTEKPPVEQVNDAIPQEMYGEEIPASEIPF